MNIPEIARALGEDYWSGGWWRCRCPVHQSRGATLALKDDDRGLAVHCHAGCCRLDVLAELRRLGLLDDKDIAQPRPKDPGKERLRVELEALRRQQRVAAALDIWAESYPADETRQVSCYLASRGITMSTPSSIRALGMHGPYGGHPSGERRPQMVGLIEHVKHGPVGVSRTYLAIDGSCKSSLSPVRLFCGPIKGGAVRLSAVRRGEWLIVAEGIETTLSAMQVSGLPGWAALSAAGLENLVLPPDARLVTICADNDASGAGQRAALRAARRWLAQQRRVRIAMPPQAGTDFNDMLIGRGRNAVA
jgi:putative DNA primase/helicase